MNYDKCLGNWENPYKNTKGIQSFEIYQNGDKAFIKISGKDDGIKPGSWGEAELFGFAQGPDKNLAAAFRSSFDLGFADAMLAINENKGLLVILAFISPKNNGQSDYFIREFYYKK